MIYIYYILLYLYIYKEAACPLCKFAHTTFLFDAQNSLNIYG